MVRISCPNECTYLTSNEGYQRERTAQAFAMEREGATHHIKDQKAMSVLAVVEAVIYQHFDRNAAAMDAEAIAGIEEIRRRFSPLTLPESITSVFGKRLWSEIEPYAKEVDQGTAADALDCYMGLARSFSGTDLQSYRFLRGLLGFLELYRPEMVKHIRNLQTDRIIHGPSMKP